LNSVINITVVPPVTTGIHTKKVTETFSVFPNPVHSVLSVSLPGKGNYTAAYKLLSLLGAEVQKGIFTAKENKLNLQSLEQGIYLLEIKNEAGVRMYKKIVKE
jgi:hypothetical protein